jgi:polyisoprenoid-binding protein YceI
MHSQVQWSCTYLGRIGVTGLFKEFHATMRVDGQNPSRWSVEAPIWAASLESGCVLRDDVLRGPDLLDVDRFPLITFRSTRVEPGEARYRVVGALSIHGVTRQVVLDFHDRGETTDWLGQRSRGLVAGTTLNRTDFQVGPPPRAGALIGSEVRISLQLELLGENAGARRVEPQRRTDAIAPGLAAAAA